MKNAAPLLIIGLLIILTGCNSPPTAPNTGNMFSVIAPGATEKKANKLALSTSKDICDEQKTRIDVIDKETTYMGIDKTQQKLIEIAGDLLNTNKTSGSYFPSKHKFRTILVFNCP